MPELGSVNQLQISSRFTALVGRELEADALTFLEIADASALKSTDVNEHIRTALLGLNETETLGGVEPLNFTSSHFSLPCSVYPLTMSGLLRIAAGPSRHFKDPDLTL